MRVASRRKILLIILIGVICYFTLLWSSRSVVSFFIPNRSVFNKSQRRSEGTILLWSQPWGVWGTSPPEGTRFGRCEITYSRRRLPQADAVVFHLTSVSSVDIPWMHQRWPEQLYVYWSMENPWVMKYLYRRDFKRFNNFFNMTMTYHRTADIYDSYGTREGTLNKVTRGKHVVDQIMEEKSDTAIWIVSNCNTMRGALERIAYVDAMVQSGFKMHRCGFCFNLCKDLPLHKADEWGNAIRKFKFYFSFENNKHCKDYMTEKFWEAALWHGVVPVVYGPKDEDVIAVAPRNSYIHADWFASPEELAQYLMFLDANNDEYRKYFAWREDEMVTVEKMEQQIMFDHPHIPVFTAPLLPQFTRLCDVALDNWNQTWIVESLVDTLYLHEREECMKPGKWENVTSLTQELEE
uniref:Fucosyltransferase n=1 Tax=Ciona intestinalis TaxID=7719 RepID=Q86NA9_CIOIN|nr:ona2 protein [Ciona intestinalis]CAD60421.1 putative alpha3-fucosyltransferase [Ciona intestinalis]|eukprot:NP_001027697.1 ona2 protein [Ciona intestinalis]